GQPCSAAVLKAACHSMRAVRGRLTDQVGKGSMISSRTEEERKRLLLSAIVTRLQAAGTDPNDVMVFFGEFDRASSSFGGGRPALPVELRPKM
ncbi:hypothetical protein, partial [Streptomyces sp. NPDC088358]|uniref:hypothetical protein n=1 Tax=Streptomyces sp. NPDC088358 TaxID=3365857 RepID=UPI0037FB0C26